MSEVDHQFSYYPYEVVLSWETYWKNGYWDIVLERPLLPYARWFKEYDCDHQWEYRGEDDPMLVSGINIDPPNPPFLFKSKRDVAFLFHTKRMARLFKLTWG